MRKIIPSTLKITETINGKKAIILVDGGSVQTKLASHLNLIVQPSCHQWVTLAIETRSHTTESVWGFP